MFNSCSLVDSGDGSKDDTDSEAAKEEVKWEKFVQLERPNLGGIYYEGNSYKFAEDSYNNGWAVSGGYFWKLTNGQWNKVKSYGDADLDAIVLVDSDNGWAVGNGSVWKLENGSWIDKSSNYGSQFSADNYKVSLIDIDTGWAVGTEGSVVKLSAGEWSLGNSGISDNFTAIGLVNGSSGWGAVYNADGNTFYSLTTANGWATTGQVTGETGIYVKRIELSAINTGFAYGNKVWELSDGNWSEVSIDDPGTGTNPKTTYLYVSKSGSDYSGWALFDPDYTKDGDEVLKKLSGNSWDEKSYSMPSGTLPVRIMNNDNNIWAVCENGAIWKFDSNEDKWILVLAGGGNIFYINYGVGADFIDINNGRVVGYAGEQGKGTNLKLENGVWSYAPSINHAGCFLSIALTGNINTGWVASSCHGSSEDGKAFANLNNGEWTLNEDITFDHQGDKVRTVVLIDKDNGWAAGSVYDSVTKVYYDTFWKLDSDTGIWTQDQQFTTNHRPSFIHLDDIDNGWATGLDGTKWVLINGIWSQSADRQGIAEAANITYEERVMFYPIDENNGWETYFDYDSSVIHIIKLVNNVWQQEVQPGIGIASPITAWAFTDMDTGWIAVNRYIYKVKDGNISKYGVDENGNTIADNYLGDYIYKIWLQDYKNGWAIGRNMNIYRLSPND